MPASAGAVAPAGAAKRAGAGRPRGRPRSEACRQAILTAAGELMLSGGLTAATMDAIAARAGVSKATIYKWWPSRGAVALDGFLDRVSGTLVIPDGLSTREALTWQLRALVDLLQGSAAGPLMRALGAEAQWDPDIARALRERWLAPRRTVALAVLRRGVERGEIRASADPEVLMDQLYAPVYYRLLFGHGRLDEDLADTLVTTLLDGVRPDRD